MSHLTEAITAAEAAINRADDLDVMARKAVEAAAPHIEAAWSQHILGSEDDPTGILDRYEMVLHDGLIGWLCRRCPHVQIEVRDLEGSQEGLTLAEMAEVAIRHESEVHATDPTQPEL